MHTARPRSLFAALALAFAVAACGGTATTGAPGGSSGSAAAPASGDAGSGSASGPTASTDASAGQPTESPADSASPASAKPAKTPKPSPSASRSPRPSINPGSAAACTGSNDNRTFFAGVAAQVDWPVICAVLPDHWFVSSGSFRLAKGGKLLISYKGPGGATLSISEGAWCTDAGGCVPSGRDLGSAALGPLSGSLIGVEGGGFAVSVDGGQPTSWLLETQGIDQATTVQLAASAVAVGD
jgi:hypothetical protein